LRAIKICLWINLSKKILYLHEIESFVHMRIIDTSTFYGSYKYANFHHAWLTFNEVWWMLYDLVKSAFCDFDFFFFVLLILKTFFLWRLVNGWNWYFIHISCWFFATLILTFLSSWLFERKKNIVLWLWIILYDFNESNFEYFFLVYSWICKNFNEYYWFFYE